MLPLFMSEDSVPQPAASSAPPTAPSHASDEYRCLTCGYSLRGLPADGSCPECHNQYPTLPPCIPAGYVCYRCAYSLADMPTDGSCPECGTKYSFAHAFRGQPYPGQSSLALRLGWPWMLALLCVIFGFLVMRDKEGVVCLASFAYLANLVNLPVSTSNVSNNYVPPSKRRGYFAAMKSLGGWVLASWILALLFLAGPIVLIAAAIISSIF